MSKIVFNPDKTQVITRTDDLQEAAWIMYKAKEQALSAIYLMVEENNPKMEFIFADSGYCRYYQLESLLMKDQQPLKWKKGKQAGLAKLNKYINGMLANQPAIEGGAA